ncbi:MAG: sulfatase [Deltaproteobacteria bacterium]|nr:sulfatase [Deltaproteobacteria bacterium]
MKWLARSCLNTKYCLLLLGNFLARLAVGLFLVDSVGCREPSATSTGTELEANVDYSDAADKCVQTDRPNILLIFSDDHTSQAISAYGSTITQTPNIDRLASQGVLFTNAMVENSICAPSRAAVLTGKFSHVNGMTLNGNEFDASQPTFPQILQQAGYQTALIGKWHLSSEPAGFDHWNILDGQGTYYNPVMISPGVVVQHLGYVTDIISEQAIDWLEQTRDPTRPFLLMIQHKATHRDWQPPLQYLNLYEDQTIPEPPTLFDDYSGRTRAAANQRMTIANDLDEWDLKLKPPDGLALNQALIWDAVYTPKNEASRALNLTGDELIRWKYQRYIKDYLRTATALDDAVGRVLDYLDRSCLAENTVVIYSADQGFFLGEHGWFDKRWIYEQSLHTPLIVRWPSVTRPGSVNDDLVQNIDFAETFLEIASIDIPCEMQGRSLVPLLRGETPEDWRTAVYYHYYEYPDAHQVEPHYGIRTKRYKLIHFYRAEVDEWEMYDLKNDPEELCSVYDDVSYETARAELETELEALREQYQVQAP